MSGLVETYFRVLNGPWYPLGGFWSNQLATNYLKARGLNTFTVQQFESVPDKFSSEPYGWPEHHTYDLGVELNDSEDESRKIYKRLLVVAPNSEIAKAAFIDFATKLGWHDKEEYLSRMKEFEYPLNPDQLAAMFEGRMTFVAHAHLFLVRTENGWALLGASSLRA